MKKLRGRVAFIFEEDNFDVDQIIGVQNIRMKNVNDMVAVMMSEYENDFAAKVRAGDLIIGGKNFGYGHPHYPPMMAMRAVGISAVIAESYSPGYWLGEMAEGFPQITCSGILDTVERWDELEVDWVRHVITNLTQKKEIAFQAFSPTQMRTLQVGGLIPLLQQALIDTSRYSIH